MLDVLAVVLRCQFGFRGNVFRISFQFRHLREVGDPVTRLDSRLRGNDRIQV